MEVNEGSGTEKRGETERSLHNQKKDDGLENKKGESEMEEETWME